MGNKVEKLSDLSSCRHFILRAAFRILTEPYVKLYNVSVSWTLGKMLEGMTCKKLPDTQTQFHFTSLYYLGEFENIT